MTLIWPMVDPYMEYMTNTYHGWPIFDPHIIHIWPMWPTYIPWLIHIWLIRPKYDPCRDPLLTHVWPKWPIFCHVCHICHIHICIYGHICPYMFIYDIYESYMIVKHFHICSIYVIYVSYMNIYAPYMSNVL